MSDDGLDSRRWRQSCRRSVPWFRQKPFALPRCCMSKCAALVEIDFSASPGLRRVWLSHGHVKQYCFFFDSRCSFRSTTSLITALWVCIRPVSCPDGVGRHAQPPLCLWLTRPKGSSLGFPGAPSYATARL